MNLYNMLPPICQDIAVSLRGWQLYKLRYSDGTWTALKKYDDSQWWSCEEIDAFVDTEMVRIVNHAYETTSFYRRFYDSRGVTLANFNGRSNLSSLPVFDKELFRQNIHECITSKYKPSEMWLASTSGTTGKPLNVYHTHPDFMKRMALLERLYGWYGQSKWRRRASFTGKLIVPVDQVGGRYFRRNWPNNQWLFSSHHLHTDWLINYEDQLEKCAPSQIDGILSPIYIIAQHLLNTGKRLSVAPAVVIPTSETLWPFMRTAISEAFGCPVASQYGSQEGAPLAYDCPAGSMHVCPESGFFEILDGQNKHCKPGQVGKLVVTSFLSTGTPLIRYSIGDTAAWADGQCSCGRRTPVLAALLGRVDDMLISSERGIIPRVDSAFKGIPASIIMSQVAQVGRDRFELRLVVDNKMYIAEQGLRIRDNLGDYLGRDVEILVRVLDSLPIGPGGKIKAMSNEWREGSNDIISEWNNQEVNL
jgi:phenylacetate-CoA ligase